MSAIVYEDGTARRPAEPWTPAVHALLRHFEAVGFEGAPRALGVDDEGREVLSFVPGEAAAEGNAPAGDDVVFGVGALVRAMHDAQRGLVPPVDARWQRLPGALAGEDVICHNDVLGHNVVFRDGSPVALIDWELAAPGLRLVDVSAAAMWWTPLRSDDHARRWGLPSDRRRKRLRLLADGYGLGEDERGRLFDTLVRLLHAWHEAYRVLGGVERRERWAGHWDTGRGEQILAGIEWIERHRAELEPALA